LAQLLLLNHTYLALKLQQIDLLLEFEQVFGLTHIIHILTMHRIRHVSRLQKRLLWLALGQRLLRGNAIIVRGICIGQIGLLLR
jgi:ABC-type uncharacterized transport system ATPase subunit